jgi:hypothetical protein
MNSKIVLNQLLLYGAGRLTGDIPLLTVYEIMGKNGYYGTPGMQPLFVLATFLVVIFLVQCYQAVLLTEARLPYADENC